MLVTHSQFGGNGTQHEVANILLFTILSDVASEVQAAVDDNDVYRLSIVDVDSLRVGVPQSLQC